MGWEAGVGPRISIATVTGLSLHLLLSVSKGQQLVKSAKIMSLAVPIPLNLPVFPSERNWGLKRGAKSHPRAGVKDLPQANCL